MSRWRSGSWTTFSASSTADCSTCIDQGYQLGGGFLDRDPNFDAHRCGVRRVDAEPERAPSRDAGGHRHAAPDDGRSGLAGAAARARTARSRFRRGRRSASTCRAAAPRAARRRRATPRAATPTPRSSASRRRRLAEERVAHPRRRARSTDGKSIAISSAKQSSAAPAERIASHSVGTRVGSSSRNDSRLTAEPANDRSGSDACQGAARMLTC